MFRKLTSKSLFPIVNNKPLNKVVLNCQQHLINSKGAATRSFSTEVPKSSGSSGPEAQSRDVIKFDSDEYDDYEPKTKQEKVSALFQQ